MAKVVLIVLALCLVQVSLARVSRDAPASPEENMFLKTLADLGRKVQDAFGEANKNVLKALGFQSNEELIESIQNNTSVYVEQLKAVQATIQEEASKRAEVFEPIVKDLTTQIEQTRKKLSEQNPEVTQKAKEYQESVQANIQTLVTEAQKVGERLKEQSQGATEKLQAALKQLYDVTVQTAQGVAAAVQPQPDEPKTEEPNTEKPKKE